MTARTSHILLVFSAFLAGLVIFLGVILFATQYQGAGPGPSAIGGPFKLIDQNGKPITDEDMKGRPFLVFFGYTHCPDACPATMSDLTYALRVQPAAIRRRVAVVFVTVDPRRDTPAVLRKWLNHYNTSFVGLTGTRAQLDVAEAQAGVPPAPEEKETGKNYSVAHSSLLFAYSPDDRAHVVYAQGFKPSDYAHDVRILLRFTHRGA